MLAPELLCTARMSPDLPCRRARVLLPIVASVLAANTARADAPNPAVPWLEGGVRAGIAAVDYTSNQFDTDNGLELDGVGYWVDAELGFRRANWTFGGTFSYMFHHDNASGSTPCGPATWDIRLHVYEVGMRATWHRHAL